MRSAFLSSNLDSLIFFYPSLTLVVSLASLDFLIVLEQTISLLLRYLVIVVLVILKFYLIWDCDLDLLLQ